MIPTTANAVQRQAWDGETGEFWASNAGRFDRGVAAYNEALLDAAGIVGGRRVLDVGCGTGAITRAAARLAAPTGQARGVDLSTRMLAVARSRAEEEQLGNVSFTRADAQVHPFDPSGVDVVVSRHGTMFFDDPVAAFGNLAAALRPGGSLALLVWQAFDRNPFMHRVLEALTPDRVTPRPPEDGRAGPVSFADPARVREVLGAAGFEEIAIDPVEELMNVGPHPAEALDYLAAQHAGLIADLDPRTRELALERLRDDVVAHHDPERGVGYPSACWLVIARRT